MFDKILIANRGEIACRVAATARRMSIRTVAVYSDADRQARHVIACDEAVHIGGSAPKDSYLRIDKVVAAALACGAQAVHPGYGFLSENEEFAQACADAGLVFIGPPPAAIQAMGLKARAKQLMERAGVPLVPGYHGADQSPGVLREAADRIGYPVLIKASAGGGGKGMRIVTGADDFDAALASCKREAIGSFGDDAVLIERYVQRPRHIEIQVFADTHGHCVYLFERDCSVQRRHQKVLEEAPAPGLSEERRQEMGAAAVAAALAVGYVGAGTVEFIAEPASNDDLRFYFMEMNTRLQVEHPVTEAITGLDLVEWQLKVACGEPLPLQQGDLQRHGHAIEARICAENPDAQFLPSTGRLEVLQMPAGARQFERGPIRFDAGVAQGDAISPYYDSMIAKLIVWGADRQEALRRMRVALTQTHIVGLHTNVEFLKRVVETDSFVRPQLDTALIERERAVLFGQPPMAAVWVCAGVAAHLMANSAAQSSADPWSRHDGWRLHGRAARTFQLELGAERVAVRVERGEHALTLSVGGQAWSYAWSTASADGYDVVVDTQRRSLQVFVHHGRCTVFGPDGSATAQLIDPLHDGADSAHSAGGLCAPMPGKVIAFLAKAGEHVVLGQPLAVMEAMKMEHTIAAPRDGKIEELLYAVGDQVDEGSDLLRMEMPA